MGWCLLDFAMVSFRLIILPFTFCRCQVPAGTDCHFLYGVDWLYTLFSRPITRLHISGVLEVSYILLEWILYYLAQLSPPRVMNYCCTRADENSLMLRKKERAKDPWLS